MTDRWSRAVRPVSAWFRRRRLAALRRLVPDIGEWHVLDVGGSVHFWAVAGPILGCRTVTILALREDGQSGPLTAAAPSIGVVFYDGARFPFGDKRYDLAICTSVIEHVPIDRREAFARELDRVARRIYVQTPAAEFPLEPHFASPFLHWLPRGFARRIAPWTPYGLAVGSSAQARAYFDEVRLLDRAAVTALFGSDGYVAERVLGLVKSHQLLRDTP